MKHLTRAALIAALMVVPIAAFADATQPPPGPPGEPPGMAQVREQMDRARAQARTTALNALTAANRDKLAQLAGQLAIAASPDVSAAAKALDSSLSEKESKAILDAQNAFEAQARQIGEQMRAQMGEQDMGPGPGGPRPSGSSAGNGPQTEKFYMNDPNHNDAGYVLLRLALPPIGSQMFYVRQRLP
jgi:hypothetical protein